MTWILLMVGAMAAQTPPPPNAVDGDATEQLREAANAYAYGQYDTCIELLRGLLEPIRLSKFDDVLEARKFLALAYYITEEHAAARGEFGKILLLEPDYQLDPFSVAPPVIEMFESVRTELAADLEVIRAARRETSAKEASTTPPELKTVLVERSAVATFLPFGVGQFSNGDNQLGVVIAAVQSVLLLANVGSYLWARFQTQDPDEIQALMVTQYATAALFGVAWSVGIFQARMAFEPYAARIDRGPAMPEGSGVGAMFRWQLDY